MTIKALLLLSLALFVSLSAHADAYANIDAVVNPGFIKQTVSALVANCFEDLKSKNIEVREMNASDSYFDTRIALPSLLERTYIVRYNPAMFANPPTAKAVTAILAHELNHLNDYSHMSLVSMAGFVTKYEISSSYQAKYERWTDQRALEMGFAEGLIEYRNWLYKNIPTEELPLKIKNYWTPAEIQKWTTTNSPHFRCMQ